MSENDDTEKVRVKTNLHGKVSGSVYHTDEEHKISKWDSGNINEMLVERKTAEMFGLRECQTCQRKRMFRENIDNGVALLGIEMGEAHLRVYGTDLRLPVGTVALPVEDGRTPWTISSLPEELQKRKNKTLDEDHA